MGEQVLIPVAAVDNHLGGGMEISQTIEALCDVVKMDDDIDPALEKIPQDNDNTTTVFDTEVWGGVWCLHKEVHGFDGPQSKLDFSVNTTTDDHYLLRDCFPMVSSQLSLRR